MIIANPELIAWGVKRLNKRVRKEANRTLLRINYGMDWLMKEPPDVVGQSPVDLIYDYEDMKVYRYKRDTPAKHEVPIVLIPPLGVMPYVYDLLPGHSMVERFLRSGYEIYSLDFGIPEFGEKFNFEHYVSSWIPRALTEIRKLEEKNELTLLGYCLGGLFAVMYTAYSKDRDIRNIVTLATPFDGYALYPGPTDLLIPLNKVISGPMATIIELFGTFPGLALKYAWRVINPTATVSKYFKLARNLWDPEFIEFYNALEKWTGDFVNYPADVVSDIYSTLLVNNDLVKGTFELEGERINVRHITSSLLSFAGDTDVLVSPRSAKALVETVGGSDKLFHISPGGHLGIVTGANAPTEVWPLLESWLSSRSGR